MVGAVNNNNSAVYTGIGAGVGVLAGGAYGGHFSKPLLKGDAPSDAFVRRYYDNDAKAQIAKAGEDAKKALTESNTYKAADDVNKLSDMIKGNAAKFGIKAEEGKTIEDAVKDFVGEETDVAKLKAKMEKAYVDTAVEAKAALFKDGKKMQVAKEAFAKLADNADEATLKTFVKEHADVLGVVEDQIEATAKSGKDEIEKLVNSSTKAITDKATELKGFINEGKLNLENASEVIKKAAKDTKIWAGAKWAIGLGALLGLGSYIGSKLAAPKNEEQA